MQKDLDPNIEVLIDD